jgi:hypothetical protein
LLIVDFLIVDWNPNLSTCPALQSTIKNQQFHRRTPALAPAADALS